MSTVRIPPVLRAQAGNNKQVEANGETVGAVLRSLIEQYPDLREQLLTADGDLNRFVNVYLNDQDVRYLGELETPVSDRDTIVVLPAMAGGDLDGNLSGVLSGFTRGASGPRCATCAGTSASAAR